MTIDKGQVNTRERALSSDWNRQVELGNRGIVEALAVSVSGAFRETGILGDTGYLVTPMNGTMKSAIAPGLALFYDSTKVFPLSTMVWCESREVREVTHDASDALSRWDVVEMRPGELISSTQPRDQFDPLTGTFTVVNMTKEIKSYPEFQIRKGTPDASPAIPAGTAGWIPLAYVLITGNAVAVDNTKIVYCRPLLSNRSIDREGWTTSTLHAANALHVQGGGIDFNGGSLAGTLRNSMHGRFGNTVLGQYHHNFRITRTTAIRLTTMTYDGGGLPGANTLLYFYAIPPPYPAGYDASLAGRELWTPSTANLYGNNGGFYDAAFQNGCIIIASTKEPDIQHPSGASAGVGQFDHEFFAEGGFATSYAPSWVYIGAGYYDSGSGEIVAQITRGAWVQTSRKAGKYFDADLPIAVPTTYNLWTEPAGEDPIELPITAAHVELQVAIELAASDSLHIELEDFFSGVGPDAVDGKPFLDIANTAGGTTIVKAHLQTQLEDDGDIRVSAAVLNGGNNNNAALVVRAYEDAVLALR